MRSIDVVGFDKDVLRIRGIRWLVDVAGIALRSVPLSAPLSAPRSVPLPLNRSSGLRVIGTMHSLQSIPTFPDS